VSGGTETGGGSLFSGYGFPKEWDNQAREVIDKTNTGDGEEEDHFFGGGTNPTGKGARKRDESFIKGQPAIFVSGEKSPAGSTNRG